MVYRESSVPQMVVTFRRPGAPCPDTAPFELGVAAPTASNFRPPGHFGMMPRSERPRRRHMRAPG